MKLVSLTYIQVYIWVSDCIFFFISLDMVLRLKLTYKLYSYILALIHFQHSRLYATYAFAIQHCMQLEI